MRNPHDDLQELLKDSKFKKAYERERRKTTRMLAKLKIFPPKQEVERG